MEAMLLEKAKLQCFAKVVQQWFLYQIRVVLKQFVGQVNGELTTNLLTYFTYFEVKIT